MVEQKICSFCGGSIEPGTGRLYVRKDGMTYNFCSSKCFKNLVVMRRLPRETEWTAAYKREKETRLAPAAKEEGEEEGKKVRRIKKVAAKAPGEEPDKASEATPEEENEGAKQ